MYFVDWGTGALDQPSSEGIASRSSSMLKWAAQNALVTIPKVVEISAPSHGFSDLGILSFPWLWLPLPLLFSLGVVVVSGYVGTCVDGSCLGPSSGGVNLTHNKSGASEVEDVEVKESCWSQGTTCATAQGQLQGRQP